MSYQLQPAHVGADKSGRACRAYVANERFRQRQPEQKHGKPFSFVNARRGIGFAWAGESTNEEEGETKIAVNLEDRRKLAITSLGNVSEYPRIVKFREFLEGWSLSYFVPDLARSSTEASSGTLLDSLRRRNIMHSQS
jgi:hypothetical protein